MSQQSVATGGSNLPVLYHGGRRTAVQPIAPVVRVENLYERDEAPEDPDDEPRLRGLLLDIVV